MRYLLAMLVALTFLSGCRSKEAPLEPAPEHLSLELPSAILGETRRINVYLPPKYIEEQGRYPVIYMPDGGRREDFPHIASTLDENIRSGKMQPVILVGIENTQRRYDLTPPTEVESDKKVAPRVGGAPQFRRFIAEELKPHIAKNYRVTENAGIIGESLAGLFIVDSFFAQPDLFDTWIALSPSLWWNDQFALKQAASTLAGWSDVNERLYLSHADETDIAPHAKALAAVFEQTPVPGLSVNYDPRMDLKHATIYRTLAPKVLPAMYPADK